MSKEDYTPTIGLEIHAELKTQTKMFCNSKNDADEERPNVNVCPICMGHPGTLPVINKEAVKHVLKIGLAVGGKLADFSEFDRKNYFYPDIPKGYQISQYAHPLVSGGFLGGVALTRIHLEEDTATSEHEMGDYSLVNFNRAGVPLMELVTEPVLHSAKEAGDFARELQLLLRYLGIAEANMEKGEMRVEANISVQRFDLSSDPRSNLGTKVEVKNLNSFKSVERAIEYEVKRHIELLENGEKIEQETSGFDENKGTTFSQRKKEDSHDYRYFPDPDLPKLTISEIAEFKAEILNKELGELPSAKRVRYESEFGIKPEDIEFFVQNRLMGSFFEAVVRFLSDKNLAKTASNYLVSDLAGLLKDEKGEMGVSLKIQPKDVADLIILIKKGELSSRGAKDILKVMYEEGGAPALLAKEMNLIQKSDEASLKSIVSTLIKDNPKVVADYKAGKMAALQFLVGQGMKASKGSANPEVLRKLLAESI